MNFKKVKEIIAKAKEVAPSQAALQLAESFEEFIFLCEARTEVRGPEAWVVYAKQVQKRREEVMAQLGSLAASLGWTAVQLKSHFENAENFSDSQWTEMQQLRREALNGVTKETEPLSRKKLKNRNKNLKI